MALLLKRWVVYFLLPLGIALNILPLFPEPPVDPEMMAYVKEATVSYPTLQLTGGVCILIGLFLWVGLYRRSPLGIPVGPNKAIVLWDAIVVLFSIMFTWWCADIVLERYCHLRSYWGDDPIKGMGVIWVVVLAPFMALFVTATALQALRIDEDGIALIGLMGEDRAAWANIEDIRIAEILTPREVGGTIAPHRTAKRLLIDAGEDSLRVMEPPLTSTKRTIIREMSAYAPEYLRPRLDACEKEWVSIW